MIHPHMATMLAVVTTDYPLEPGEAIEFLRPGRRRELQLDLRRRRVLDERHRAAARQRRRAASSARRRPTPSSRPRCARSAPTSRGQIVADGEGATLTAEIAVAGRVDRRRGAGDRRARSPPRRSSRPRSSAATRTGAGSSPRPARRASTAASRGSTRRCSRSRVDGVDVYARRPADRRRAGARLGHVAIELDLGLGDGARRRT